MGPIFRGAIVLFKLIKFVVTICQSIMNEAILNHTFDAVSIMPDI